MAGTTEGRDTGPGIRLQGPRKRGGEASTPGRGSKGSGWHHMAPPGETAKPRGKDDQACPPHLRPRSITGRRARGRQDVTCADQAPAPIQLRGGNALSHSYERSSLLEGRRRAQSHTIPRLSATRAGVGRWVPEAWGPQQSPPAREPAPRHTVYLGPQAGKGGWDLTPKPASKQHRLVGVTSWPGKSLCPRVVLEPATPETPSQGNTSSQGSRLWARTIHIIPTFSG